MKKLTASVYAAALCITVSAEEQIVITPIEGRATIRGPEQAYTGAAIAEVLFGAAATKPLFAWQGANNRVRMAVIGMGGRSGRVFDSLTRYDDVQFTMGCEVAALPRSIICSNSFGSDNPGSSFTVDSIGSGE
jgi:hypothetical protein